MGAFEYLLILAAVILGLALSDLALSLHRLLSAGRRVRWDWLAPLAAIVAFLKIVTQWWAWFSGAGIAKTLTFEMYVGELAGALLLFLLAAAALPDEAGEDKIDLAAHYAAVSRRYWLLFAAQWIVLTAVNLWAVLHVAGPHKLEVFWPAWFVLPVTLSLVFIKNRWWHTGWLVALVVVYLAQFFGQGLGA
ncbi:MAG TPA: hypothetical protein VKU90_05360 [Caulobacteraceae bacterium]|nr:hypothetical protein [Caulobacteraceae bacterium]